ncbi:MAG TPA: hypothetical protein VKR53_05600 [Puia sp.]|nr:hypothetical protein [Puia sp.]
MRECNFLKLKSAAIPMYRADVSDERGNRHYFSIVNDDAKWVIGKTTPPAWILFKAQ